MRIRHSVVAGVTLGLVAYVAAIVPAALPASAAPPTQGWTTTPAPLPGDAGTNPSVYIASSTCPATGACQTVGSYKDTANKYWGLIETQSGTSWSETMAPEPSNAGSGSNQFAELGSQFCGIGATTCTAVSCPTVSWCVAVGQYKNTTGFNYPLIDTLSGGAWSSPLPPAEPTGAGTEGGSNEFAWLQSVSCSSTTACVAVGGYENSSGRTQPLIAVMAGTTWTELSAPLPLDVATPATGHSVLTTVSCSSPTSCVAGGSYIDNTASSGQNGFIETLSGTTWSAISTPLPSNTGTDTLANLIVIPYSVSCASSTACVLVGVYGDTTGKPFGLIDTLSGSTWTAHQAPEPSSNAGSGTDQQAFLESVSCPAAASCVAVGFYEDTGARTRALIDSLSGGSWVAAEGPQPNNAAPASAQSSVLFTVDCSTTTSCLASGSYAVAGNGSTGLVDTLAAGSWTGFAPPVPNTAKSGTGASATAKSVACASPVACVVAGFFTDSAGNVQGFLDTLTGGQGYWMSASDGGMFTFGNLGFFGSTGGIHLNKPVVGMAPTPDNNGYWEVASDGGIFSFGDAGYYGSTGGIHLNKPIVGMAATPTGHGYWLVASDGGIFSFGDAVFYGSTGAIVLNKPIVGMAATPTGHGYWLVASDGGIFTFGDAVFMGSTGAITLNKPIVGMAADPNGDGYWLVASDGGIFTFGRAVFYGSTGNIVLNKPIVGMAVTPTGLGYWLVASDGGIFSFADAVFYGSTGNIVLNKPIVGMAT